MGIDAEDVIVYLWRFLRFFINTANVCVQKHPFVSCTLLIGFLVYVFFNVLLYHLPFLVFVAILLRIFWSSERQQDDKTTNERQTDHKVVNDREMPSFQRQKSRRTQFSKDRAFHAILSNDAVNTNGTKPVVVREVERVVRDSDEEEEEEMVSNNKAVEWNEDDQKNVDDLGISEIERNRRLESLIAKRRARKREKLCSTISDPSAAFAPSQKVAAAVKTNPFEEEDDREDLQAPGSAPSVLFPGKNPFDIPYDQKEEKPDLTVDSFQEEFSAADEKDSFMYCRHESFCYGGFDSQFESERDRHEAKLSAFFGTHKRGFARPSDNDRLIDQLLDDAKPGPHIDGTASQAETGAQHHPTQTLVDVETSKLRDTKNDTANPSTSETTSSCLFEASNRSIKDGSSVPPNVTDPHYDTSPTSNDKNRNSAEADDRMFFGDKLTVHTPSYSIASDLQVEVSETCSPPLTIGNVSPNDVESLSFDEEMEHAQLSFDMESLDDINQALEKVAKLREASSSEEATTMQLTMQLARQLSSHPFFESVYGTTEKTHIPPDDETGNDFIDEITMTEQPEETDIEGNSQSLDEHQSLESGDTDLNYNINDNDVVKDNSHEEEVENEEESLVEEVSVNLSSPSSPASTPSGQILADIAFSSTLNQRELIIDEKSHTEKVVTSSLIDEQSTNNGTSSVPLPLDDKGHKLHSSDFETLQEKSESKIDEPRLVPTTD